MQNKAQMSMTKLGLMFLGLTIVWIMCSRAELLFQSRFEDEVIQRMGGKPINQTKLKLAQQIQSDNDKQLHLKSIVQYQKMLKQSYFSQKEKEQQLICILIRDFDTQDNLDKDYATVRSILKQNYKNFHIIYLSEEGDNSVPKLQSYLDANSVLDDQRDFVTSKADTIIGLFKASDTCPKGGIMLMLQNEEILISPSVLKVINSQFTPDIDFTWASSLYQNGKTGFSFEISEQIKKKNSYRNYPLPMNDVIAYRNDFFIRNKSSFTDHRLYYPLYITQSFGFTFLKEAKGFKYIPEILTIKNRKAKIRAERSVVQKQLEELIRKDESILPMLKTFADDFP